MRGKRASGVDWPLRLCGSRPLDNSYVEEVHRRERPRAEGLAQLPDGEFSAGRLQAELRRAAGSGGDWPGAGGAKRLLTIGRWRSPDPPSPKGRAACPLLRDLRARLHYALRYFSSIGSTLPAARRNRTVDAARQTTVWSRRSCTTSATDRATGVRAVDAATMQPFEFRSRLIFLCASALESARILLNSKTARFPTGLANSSGELGAQPHGPSVGRPGPTARFPAWMTTRPSGTVRMGIYVPRFRNVTDKHPQFVRGYGFQGGAARRDWDAARRPLVLARSSRTPS